MKTCRFVCWVFFLTGFSPSFAFYGMSTLRRKVCVPKFSGAVYCSWFIHFFRTFWRRSGFWRSEEEERLMCVNLPNMKVSIKSYISPLSGLKDGIVDIKTRRKYCPFNLGFTWRLFTYYKWIINNWRLDGLVSNCIMELFGETLSIYYFIGYYEVARKTGLKIA